MQNQRMNKDLVAYYAARASEYEALYARPECGPEIHRIAGILQDVFRGKSVLEVACGTGYWTQQIAQTATSVLASDINAPMLRIAGSKIYPKDRVRFVQDDIFQSAITGVFDAVFGGFIWSHILLAQLNEFIAVLTGRIQPGGLLVLADNRFVPGHSTPIAETDAAGNTYQLRRLKDNSEHLVLKNFPDQAFFQEKLAGQGLEVAWIPLHFYWLAVCKRAVVP